MWAWVRAGVTRVDLQRALWVPATEMIGSQTQRRCIDREQHLSSSWQPSMLVKSQIDKQRAYWPKSRPRDRLALHEATRQFELATLSIMARLLDSAILPSLGITTHFLPFPSILAASVLYVQGNFLNRPFALPIKFNTNPRSVYLSLPLSGRKSLPSTRILAHKNTFAVGHIDIPLVAETLLFVDEAVVAEERDPIAEMGQHKANETPVHPHESGEKICKSSNAYAQDEIESMRVLYQSTDVVLLLLTEIVILMVLSPFGQTPGLNIGSPDAHPEELLQTDDWPRQSRGEGHDIVITKAGRLELE
ncbi:uncharacterized protein BDR25DRAFT_357833 [Lindgomyces ingoldianus]|uniref:Uncharacterized protein n=1 Tax=Lindgomyces ingoldianus TaxID=673940 RepID=A0ACB6QME1_9PLEO|nr:uncharacterized protein BDR25DRAFT_357833 [Lindgomyces ingoldianus]KAF2468076.1 hypothetical protein BDR25DRAFT_357833 [Lindgomyces ingoldianus]